MSWVEILGLGILGGLICGGFFFALGTVLDWLENRAYDKALAEAEEAWQNAPNPFIPPQRTADRDGTDDGA